ncbi:hypothetical protein STAN_7097 [Streptomyces sp. CBMAI 2042]|nr:hypothetical protein STAN_7097 [Streptomyces sp. CBMAI 2042]
MTGHLADARPYAGGGGGEAERWRPRRRRVPARRGSSGHLRVGSSQTLAPLLGRSGQRLEVPGSAPECAFTTTTIPNAPVCSGNPKNVTQSEPLVTYRCSRLLIQQRQPPHATSAPTSPPANLPKSPPRALVRANRAKIRSDLHHRQPTREASTPARRSRRRVLAGITPYPLMDR